MAELIDWEKAAADNNSAPPNGLPEGMVPSSLNNTNREGMAVLARFYEAVSGKLITTGSGDAYVLMTSQTIGGAYQTGDIFSFTANRDNTGAATLNINGIGVAGIRRAGDVELVSGDIRSGGVYTVTFTGTYFIMHGATSIPPNFIFLPWNFDASGDDQTSYTWNKPDGLRQLYVKITGGGAGSGAGQNNAGGNASQSGSGAGSGTIEALLDGPSLPASVPVLVGKGGDGGTIFPDVIYPGDGFASSFLTGTTSLTAHGGGASGNGVDSHTMTLGGPAVQPVVVAGADLIRSFIHPANKGIDGYEISSNVAAAPQGGHTIYGIGDGYSASSASGTPVARAWGCGASGAGFFVNGFIGANGIVEIIEYF